jgi:hypothetical protein
MGGSPNAGENVDGEDQQEQEEAKLLSAIHGYGGVSL